MRFKTAIPSPSTVPRAACSAQSVDDRAPLNEAVYSITSSICIDQRRGATLRIARFVPVLGFLVFPLRGEAPKFRLGDAVTPARYRLELTLVPFALTFSGAVAIDLQLHSAVTEIWLSSQELTIRDATLTAGNDTLPAHIVSAGNGLAGFAFERAIQPGSAALHIKFEGRLNSSTNVGLFNAKEGDDSYIFSQFQPFDARRAFPCFDEPSFKAPWQITLHVKSSHTALSNAPVVSEVPEPGGMKAVRFAETKPLPTYLVAMEIGRASCRERV